MKVSVLKNRVGYWFTGYIEGTPVEGRIQKGREGHIFFCQNLRNGTNCSDKLGFDYSWIVLKDDVVSEMQHVHDLTLFKEKPETFTYKPNSLIGITIGKFKAMFYPDVCIRVGCQLITVKAIDTILKTIGNKKLKGSITDHKKLKESKRIALKRGYKLSIVKGVGVRVVDGSTGIDNHTISYDEIKEIARKLKPVPATAKK